MPLSDISKTYQFDISKSDHGPSETGLSNGSGFSNKINSAEKSGLLDGNGLTNGNGLTIVRNYIKMDNGKHKRIRIKNVKAKNNKNKYLSIIIAIILIILPLNIYFWNFNVANYSGIIIDGRFSDWEGIEFNEDTSLDQNDNVNVDLVRYQAISDESHYSFYVEVYGTIFNGIEQRKGADLVSSVDTIHIFIDNDNDINTGYNLNNLGADYLLEAKGCKNIIFESSLKEFNPTRSQNDWNGWTIVNTEINTGIREKQFESQIPKLSNDNADLDPIVLFHIMDHKGNEDYSDIPINLGKGILLIDQKNIGENVLNLNSRDNEITQIQLISEGIDINLDSLLLNRKGTVSDSDTEEISLYLGKNKISEGRFINGQVDLQFNQPVVIKKNRIINIDVKIDISAKAQKSNVLGIEIASKDDIAIDRNIPIIIESDIDLKYIEEISDDIIIDGAFLDWKNVPVNLDIDEARIQNSNVDIEKYQVSCDEGHLSFRFDVRGKVLEGTLTPSNSDFIVFEDSRNLDADNGEKVGEGVKKNDNTVFQIEEILPELSGEDTAHIFIDADSNIFTGYNAPGMPVGAEYMIEITGKNYIALDHGYFRFNGISQDTWNWESLGQVAVGLDDNKLETQLDLESIGLDRDNEYRIFFHVSDWNEKSFGLFNEDFTDKGYSPSSTDDEILVLEKNNENQYLNNINKGVSNSRSRANLLKHVVNGTGDSSSDGFGWNVSYAKDINKDGFSDVIVGAPFNDSEGADAGAAFVFFGYSTINLNNINAYNANVTLYGASAGENFGWDVSDAGDVNNDNFEDIIIGC
jgi:hypothetical protein